MRNCSQETKGRFHIIAVWKDLLSPLIFCLHTCLSFKKVCRRVSVEAWNEHGSSRGAPMGNDVSSCKCLGPCFGAKGTSTKTPLLWASYSLLDPSSLHRLPVKPIGISTLVCVSSSHSHHSRSLGLQGRDNNPWNHSSNMVWEAHGEGVGRRCSIMLPKLWHQGDSKKHSSDFCADRPQMLVSVHRRPKQPSVRDLT